MMNKIRAYHKKSKILLQFLQNAHHIGTIKAAKIIKKRIYCKINGYPNSFIVEPASKCNLSCAMCWAYKAKEFRKKNILEYLEYKKLLDDIENICSKILLSFCGEPMINKDIYKMIEYANQKDIITEISTNGMLLTEENSIKLLESSPYEVVISLDTINSQTYKSMRIGGNFNEVVSNVEFLTKEKKKRGLSIPLIVLQMVLTKKNENEINDFIRFAQKIQADKVKIKSLFIDHHGDDNYINKLKTDFLTNNHVSRYTKSKKKEEIILKKAKFCPNTKSTVISSDGDVYICCFDIFGEYNQGNAINENFLRIWNKPGYKRFREEEMFKRKLPLCRTCTYSEVPEINLSLKQAQPFAWNDR